MGKIAFDFNDGMAWIKATFPKQLGTHAQSKQNSLLHKMAERLLILALDKAPSELTYPTPYLKRAETLKAIERKKKQPAVKKMFQTQKFTQPRRGA